MSKTVPTRQERVMKSYDFIISKTDTKGKLTYCNEIFMDMAMMTERELLGKPHSIIRHPDMPKIVFTLLFITLSCLVGTVLLMKNPFISEILCYNIGIWEIYFREWEC